MWTGLLALGFGWWSARAADVPVVHWTQSGALAFQPVGVLYDATAEVQVPVMRYGGAVFNQTFLGAGGRLSVSPAFAEAAARISVMPVDVLPITVELVHSQYWRSPFGMIGFDEGSLVGRTDGPDRAPRYALGEGFGGAMWSLILSPTFQIRLGPVVGFTNWKTTFLTIQPYRPQADPWVFEPYRGMVVGFEDRLVEHTSALLWEPLDGEEGALLRLGGVIRGKFSAVTPDLTLMGGPAAQFRPDARSGTPTVMVLVAPYWRDPDLVGPIPFVAALASWEGDWPL